jgi:hypothetical protein
MRHALLLAFLFASPAYAVDERYPDYELRPGLAGEASVEGAPAPASLMLLWPESFRMAQPGVALRTGPVEGGVRVKAAVEAVAVLVNAENPLTCISLEDMNRLYTEENPRWSGGAPAIPLAREAGPGEGDFFAEAVIVTANQAVETAQQLLDLSNRDRDRISGLGRAAASSLQVHRALMERPITTAGRLVEKTGITPATVNKALGHLEKLGIVKELTAQKRNRLFSYTGYVEIMNRGTELPGR